VGRIGILVNNARDAWFTHTLNTTDKERRYCMDVNLHSAIDSLAKWLCHCGSKAAGRIINFSTIAAHMPLSAVVMDYLAAKAGCFAFSKGVSIELVRITYW
jgi:3-oxoacyl-[acyl-carrier protein] reductase